VKTPEPPEELSDGLHTAVETDGRVKFILMRRKKPVGQVTLPASEAVKLPANALGGAYDAFDQAAMGLVRQGSQAGLSVRAHPGLGLGPARSRNHACLVVRVGTAEVGFAFPRKKLKGVRAVDGRAGPAGEVGGGRTGKVRINCVGWASVSDDPTPMQIATCVGSAPVFTGVDPTYNEAIIRIATERKVQGSASISDGRIRDGAEHAPAS